MIGLLRKPVADPAREWLRRREAAYRTGQLRADDKSYSDHRVKEALKAESHEKCAYCESRFSAVYYGDVEHIIPKGSKPELRLSYDNLLFSCAICNNGKRRYFAPSEPLLNPYVDDPGDHLRFFGPLVAPMRGSVRGQITIGILKLNRPELFEERVEALSRILPLITEIFRTPITSLKAVLIAELHRSLGDDTEFAAMLRQYVKSHDL